MIEGMLDKGLEKLANRRSFLEHQKRDLVACVPSERAGRLLEIEQLNKEISELEKTVARLQQALGVDEALDEAIGDLIDNIRGLNSTIQSEYERCPDGYTEGYDKAYNRVVSVLTRENIMRLLHGDIDE